MQPDLLKGHLEGLVLAVLAERPIHGYAVMESLRARSGGAIGIEGGTLYPLLHRLEEAGLVRSSWSTQSGRRRRTYSLTARGKRALVEKQGAWHEFVAALGSIMTEASPGTAK
ncbi:MAG: PadR family transcriptional regulator [Actinomycetota bacterium]